MKISTSSIVHITAFSACASVSAFVAPDMRFSTAVTQLMAADTSVSSIPPVSGEDENGNSTPPSPPPLGPTINGWTPDATKACYGLPGALAPTGYFDPLGFAREGNSLNDIKRLREAEVMHGRVAMIATVGYFVGETVPSPFGIVGPANDQLQQMPLPAFVLLTVAIAAAELRRAQIGWVEPEFNSWYDTFFRLRDTYYPGDVGFDPLNLKPTDKIDFQRMQTKELQNGRLAMIGVAGMCAQELVNHRTILETIDFYSKVYNGENPYAACGEGIIC